MKNNTQLCFAVLYVLILMCFAPSIVMSDDNSSRTVYGKVLLVSGEVNVSRTDIESSSPIQRGDFVYLGDVVTTGKKSKSVLVSTKKKIINLSENSKLNIGEEQGLIVPIISSAMFEEDQKRINPSAQATTRNSDVKSLVLSPRNSVIQQKPIELQLAKIENGYTYQVELVSVNPPFLYETKINSSSMVLDENKVGHPIQTGVEYKLYVKLFNPHGREMQRETLSIGVLDQEQVDILKQLEDTLQPFLHDDEVKIAYQTILAEAYEESFLFHDAITLYEEILQTSNEQDRYSAERLKHLYTITKDSEKLKKIQ